MCTVTYFPYQSGFILTSSRDELATRKPSDPPSFDRIEDVKVLYPRDGEAGGTWLVASEQGRVVCLLNGAYENHERTPPYRKSRGIVVKETMLYTDIDSFLGNYDLLDIEPFTMIWVEQSEAVKLYEIRWDGKSRHCEEFDAISCHIWSSATLYNRKQQLQRAQWFDTWFEEDVEYDPIKVLDFHNNAGEEDESISIKMKRPSGVQTVSITNVVGSSGKFRMYQNNLLEDYSGSEEIDFSLHSLDVT